ncbi:hypothetical protein [Luteimonas salinilitoris]|uniref:Uncharacterized protein n=1 Tax=Luteimonas salinilitoris TaxID=3237697 RepID=A0ABV4HQM7_9GAMM
MKSCLKLAALAAAAAFCLPAQAQTPQDPLHFSGTDRNWFNPRNWSAGRVPTAADDVVLDRHDRVVIDPASGDAWVRIRDLDVRGNARLTTLPGTVLQLRDEVIGDDGQIVYRASGTIGEHLIAAPAVAGAGMAKPGFGNGGIKLNPTPKSKRDLILKSSFPVQFGLGGLQPASLHFDAGGTRLAAGPGHYATITTETAILAGDLRLSLHYGFRPMAGDRFTIIDISRRSLGRFDAFPEGSPVGCTADRIGLYISYVGGDGNDVELSARRTDPVTCLLLPAIQHIRETAG